LRQNRGKAKVSSMFKFFKNTREKGDGK
jgi:hypothetical protein